MSGETEQRQRRNFTPSRKESSSSIIDQKLKKLQTTKRRKLSANTIKVIVPKEESIRSESILT